jgi:hypothetical protein
MGVFATLIHEIVGGLFFFFIDFLFSLFAIWLILNKKKLFLMVLQWGDKHHHGLKIIKVRVKYKEQNNANWL